MSFYIQTYFKADQLKEELEKLRKIHGEELKIHGFSENEKGTFKVLIEIDEK